MSFSRLYEHAAGLRHWPVRVETDLVPKVIELTAQDEIYFAAVELDHEISYGHIKQSYISKGVYDQDPTFVVDIRYSNKLNICWSRYVCAKELMHCFDSDVERSDTPEKFQTLLKELETPPPADRASPMFQSENKTKWMALAVLCPLPLRERFLEEYKKEPRTLSDYEIALELRIPQAVVPAIMGDNFEAIVGDLVRRG